MQARLNNKFNIGKAFQCFLLIENEKIPSTWDLELIAKCIELFDGKVLIMYMNRMKADKKCHWIQARI